MAKYTNIGIGDRATVIESGISGIVVDIRLYYGTVYIYLKLDNGNIVCYYPFELECTPF